MLLKGELIMMSEDFKNKLFPILPDVIKNYGTPFHIYDHVGIRQTCQNLKETFKKAEGFKEFFAVKANPNIEIMKIIQDEGFGFDCSSIPEIKMARAIGSYGENIIFTSNNTSEKEFSEALERGGCILNLDDISFIEKISKPFPELICFRYNPGSKRTGKEILGNPEEQKYGIRHDQLIPTYKLAIKNGAKRFGIHSMICSNQLDYNYIADTVKMLLEAIEIVSEKLNIKFEFLNMGGGIGIPYKPKEKEMPLKLLADKICGLLDKFKKKYGYAPKLFMECGRYITGPHGILVTTVINKMSKYRKYVGVDACMSSLMRPAIYGAYHHISVNGKNDNDPQEIVDIVGSLCENNDKFAIQRKLPKTEIGDSIIIHDAGAHGYAMCFQYNGRLRPKELLLRNDGSVILIRREESYSDYIATQNFMKRIYKPKS